MYYYSYICFALQQMLLIFFLIIAARYNPCKLELRNLVHKQRNRYNEDILSKDLLIDDMSPWESQLSLSNWKPKGLLVAHLHEHRGSINR